MKREARQNYYRQMHKAAREIYEAGQADERERIIRLWKNEMTCDCESSMLHLFELIKGETDEHN